MNTTIKILIGLCFVLLSQYVAAQELEVYQIGISKGHATLLVAKNSRNQIVKSVLIDAGMKGDAQLIKDKIGMFTAYSPTLPTATALWKK